MNKVPLFAFLVGVIGVMGMGGVQAETKFRVGIEIPTQVPVTPAIQAALKDIGISYMNYYIVAQPGVDLPAKETNDAMMRLADLLGIDFSIACCQANPPDECVKDAVAHAKASNGKQQYLGTVFDELEHVRLMNPWSSEMLADTSKFKTLDEAYDASIVGFTKLHDKFAALGSTVTATHVWPLMLHNAARAGFTPCPKICKELYSTISLAIGMGAAKQYGRDLWVDCDLWYWDLVPGHTPEETKSNLLLAYWLGADLVYVEGSGYNLKPAGKQGTPFSLVNQIGPDTYSLTPHGEALRWFCREYLPAHPRKWTFRDVKPNIAVIRFEDGCHGQRYSTGWADNLYGSPNLHSDRDTEAWLGLWNLLTFGKAGRDGITFFKGWTAAYGYQRGVTEGFQPSYLTRPVQSDLHRFFVPMNGVVVYDHTAGYDLLKDIPLLCLTGKEVSDTTMAAIRRCVNEGAVCLAWGPLAVQHGFKDWISGVKIIPEGKGKFILTDDFGASRLYNEIWSYQGHPDEIRYRFATGEVVLRRVSDDSVAVELR